jgi:hypothetical protein
MKKVSLLLLMVMGLSLTTVACRETNEEKVEDVTNDVGGTLEDTGDDAKDAIEEGAEEVKENTGTGGTDDY